MKTKFSTYQKKRSNLLLNKKLAFLSLLSISISAHSASTTLFKVIGPNITDETSTWSAFDNLAGGIQHYDIERYGANSTTATAVWAADSNTLTNYTGTYSHTFSTGIKNISADIANQAFAVLDNGELWQVSSGTASNVTNTWSSFSNLSGGIQYFDAERYGEGSVGAFWAADSHTLTESTGTYSHTFSETITSISADTTGQAFATLANGELWKLSSGVASNVTNAWASFGALSGGIQHFDIERYGEGYTAVWAADSNTLTNYTGSRSYTFEDVITDISADTTVQAFTVVSAVPVPAAFWLFGSGLIGLVGFARRKKA